MHDDAALIEAVGLGADGAARQGWRRFVFYSHYWNVIAREPTADAAIYEAVEAWIASLSLAMTTKRLPQAGSPPLAPSLIPTQYSAIAAMLAISPGVKTAE